MPFFEVVKGQDAYVEYSRVIEADDAQAAFQLACTREYRNGEDWIANGNVDEYDDTTVFDDRTELLDAETFEEAVKQVHDAYDFVEVRLKPDELEFIRAKVATDLLTFMSHHARGGLFPAEMKKMNWLDNLNKTLKVTTNA